MMTKSFLSILLLALLVLTPIITVASAECTCDSETELTNKSEALKYKWAAFASILIASAIGVCLPILGRTISALKPEKDVFFIIKALAAGVILATGFVHVLPDASEHLTSPCLKGEAWEFPWTGLVAMVSAIVVLMIDVHATSYFSANSKKIGGVTGGGGDEEGGLDVHTHASHGHSHAGFGGQGDGLGTVDLLRHRVIAQVLELGIVVHSVIIGISLGASQTPKTIRPLMAALTFHQFFEGMGLGGCIAQAKFKTKVVAIMSTFFSLTTPVGIIIGILISNRYDENSQTALILEGFLNAASAGILIYMALVDLLAADFMGPRLQSNRKLQYGASVALLVGVGCMSLLAKWA